MRSPASDRDVMTVCYHPDPKINAEIAADALAAERADLAAGYPPRRWCCACGAGHSRGHFGVIGVHCCLACGYTGTGGIFTEDETPASPWRPNYEHLPHQNRRR